MKVIWIGLAVLTALLAHEFFNQQVPEHFSDPTGLRILGLRFHYLLSPRSFMDGFLFGKEAGYLTWIHGLRLPFVAKPDRIEEGLQIKDTKFEHVPVRLYIPLNKETNGPGIVFIHGGGWIVGSVELFDIFCREWARKLNMVVVSVEYRLAPEHPYPVPFEDCFVVGKHFLNNAKDYDVDPHRIVIAGSSAGGNLAAAVTLKLRDTKNKIQPKLQLLIYPVTQMLDFNTPSFIKNEMSYLQPKELLVAMVLFYAQGSAKHIDEAAKNNHVTKDVKERMSKIIDHRKLGSTSAPELTEGNLQIWNELKDVLLDPYFAPLMAEDLSNLPKTMVYTVEHDVLRDDGILYARRLEEAGNSVEHFYYTEGFHCLNSFGEVEFGFEEAVISNDKMRAWIKANI